MAEATREAGPSASAFHAMLEHVVADPERAFEDLRALLFDVSRDLLACSGAPDAQLVLERFQSIASGRCCTTISYRTGEPYVRLDLYEKIQERLARLIL